MPWLGAVKQQAKTSTIVNQDLCCNMASLWDNELNPDGPVQDASDIWSCFSALNVNTPCIQYGNPCWPLMAGNQGNQAIWWLAMNTPVSRYRWEEGLSHP